MFHQQFAHHRRHIAAARALLPVGHGFLAARLGQRAQPVAKKLDVPDKKIIVFEQQRHAFILGQVQLQTRAAAHGSDQAFRHRHVADFFTFAFDVDRARGVKTAQRRPDATVKGLLRRLRLAGNQAQHR